MNQRRRRAMAAHARLWDAQETMMKFRYSTPTTWTAQSQRYPDLLWRITICEDGEFIISESDQFLFSTCRKLPTFTMFRAAVAWCERMESPIGVGR